MKTHPHTPLAALGIAGVALLLGGCGRAPDAAVEAAVPAASAVAKVSDIDVTSQVKTALLQDPALKAFDITVVTLNGDVRLTGMLDSQMQIDDALRIARSASGTHSVHDELTLKK